MCGVFELSPGETVSCLEDELFRRTHQYPAHWSGRAWFLHLQHRLPCSKHANLALQVLLEYVTIGTLKPHFLQTS
jgi:hypothetical protein